MRLAQPALELAQVVTQRVQQICDLLPVLPAQLIALPLHDLLRQQFEFTGHFHFGLGQHRDFFFGLLLLLMQGFLGCRKAGAKVGDLATRRR